MREKDVSRLLTDEYAERILVATQTVSRSVQEISDKYDIPIAACYRKIHELEGEDDEAVPLAPEIRATRVSGRDLQGQVRVRRGEGHQRKVDRAERGARHLSAHARGLRPI